MQIGIRKELGALETRVAITPEGVTKLSKLGFTVVVEKEAGLAASYPDAAYAAAGATLVSREEVYSSDIIYALNALSLEEINKLKAGTTVVSFVAPYQNQDYIEVCKAKNITLLAMDMVPRISRAQAMDALSSLANIAGYRSVVEAASQFGRFLNGQITAAGKIAPAKVLVLGAGVAGLAAIGTAKNLGAVVRATDVRPEVKEQVESMGAKFLVIDTNLEKSTDGYAKETTEDFNKKAAALYAQQAKEVDIIITTAAIPGRKAPTLLTKEMIDSMKPGSVVVDLAAATGGNCEYTEADKVITTANEVKVVGYTHYYSMLANQASELYSNNLVNLTKLLTPNKDGKPSYDLNDVIVRNMTITLHNEKEQEAEVLFPPPAISVSAAPAPSAAKAEVAKEAEKKETFFSRNKKLFGIAVFALVFVQLMKVLEVLPPSFMANLNVFVVASILGYFIIWNVVSALHTPLMSLTNALSGIVLVGAISQMTEGGILATIIALIAIFIAGLNVFGGFAVTHRMLKMFIKKGGK